MTGHVAAAYTSIRPFFSASFCFSDIINPFPDIVLISRLLRTTQTVHDMVTDVPLILLTTAHWNNGYQTY